MARTAQVLVGFSVSALAVYLLFQQIEIGAVVRVLREAQALPMVAVVLLVGGALLTRVYRWAVLFQPERRVPLRPLVETLTISYMASTFLPLRAGELVRAAFLARRQLLPFPLIVATILLEKLFDFLSLGVILLVLLATTPLPDGVVLAGSGIVTVILLGFGFVVALAVWRGPVLSLLGRVERLLPPVVRQRLPLVSAVAQFVDGTGSLRHPSLWVPLLGWSAATWICSLVAAWAAGVAVGVNPGLAAVAFMVLATSAGQAVPSSPGYVGVFHLIAVTSLTAFGVDPAAAAAMAVLSHALTYGTLVVGGLVALWVGGYGAGDLLLAARQTPPAPEAASVGVPRPEAQPLRR